MGDPMSIRVHAVRSLLIGAAALAVATPAWAQTTEEQQAQATNDLDQGSSSHGVFDRDPAVSVPGDESS